MSTTICKNKTFSCFFSTIPIYFSFRPLDLALDVLYIFRYWSAKPPILFTFIKMIIYFVIFLQFCCFFTHTIKNRANPVF